MSESLLDLKYHTTPQQYAEAIRDLGAISWWETDGFWLVTDYQIAKEVLMDQRFSADRTEFFQRRTQSLGLPMIKDFFSVVNRMMVMQDNEAHYARRKICSHGIVHYIKSNMGPAIDQQLAVIFNALASETFDFAKSVAEPLPVEVMADILSIPDAERDAFFQASLDMNMFFGGANEYLTPAGADLVNLRAAYLKSVFSQMLTEKRAHPDSGFIGILLKHQTQYALTDDDLVSQLVMVLNAGTISLSDQMCNAFYQILSRADLTQQLSQDMTLIPDVLKEAIRLDPTVTFTFRVAKEDMRLHGEKIKAGEAVFISNHAVNRDPSIFPNPHEIDCQQAKKNDFSFSYGSHFCLGYRLAMLIMQKTLEKLLRTYPSIAVDQANTHRRHDSIAFSGFEQLQLRKGLTAFQLPGLAKAG